jgi:hypothetical protein
MSAHEFTLPGDYANHPAALVLLEAATAEPPPSAFQINTNLKAAGDNAFRVRELLDGHLHVQVTLPGGLGRYWQRLDSLAASILD